MRHRLALFRKICRADCNSLFRVKKITLSERSELGIFSEKESVRKVVDSTSTSKPFRELFCLLFLRCKKVRVYETKVIPSNTLSTMLHMRVLFFEYILIVVMSLFSFACPKEKVTKKEKDKVAAGHYVLFLRISFTGIINSLDRRTDFYVKISIIFSEQINTHRRNLESATIYMVVNTLSIKS